MKNRECSLSQNVWLCVTADFCHNISDYWIFLSDWWPAPAPACGWENTSKCLYAAIIVRYKINQMHWKMVYGMRIVIHISALFHSQQQNTPFYEKKKRSNKIKWIKSGFVSKSWKPKKVIHSLSLEFARLTTAGPMSWSGSISSYLKCQQNFSSLELKPHTCRVSTRLGHFLDASASLGLGVSTIRHCWKKFQYLKVFEILKSISYDYSSYIFITFSFYIFTLHFCILHFFTTVSL